MLTTAGLTIPDYIGQDGLRRPVRHTNEFWDSYGIAVHDDVRQKADLVFFSRTGVFPSHIGIMRDEESYIHAPGHDGSKVAVRFVAHEAITSSKGETLLYTRNPIGYKSPTQQVEESTYRYHQQTI